MNIQNPIISTKSHPQKQSSKHSISLSLFQKMAYNSQTKLPRKSHLTPSPNPTRAIPI